MQAQKCVLNVLWDGCYLCIVGWVSFIYCGMDIIVFMMLCYITMVLWLIRSYLYVHVWFHTGVHKEVCGHGGESAVGHPLLAPILRHNRIRSEENDGQNLPSLTSSFSFSLYFSSSFSSLLSSFSDS